MSSKIEYTCKGKGGRYEILGLATGAGLTRGEDRLIYKDASTGRLFLRTESDFSERMELLQAVAESPLDTGVRRVVWFEAKDPGPINDPMHDFCQGFNHCLGLVKGFGDVFTAPYTHSAELAELQAAIAQLTASNEALRVENAIVRTTAEKYTDMSTELTAEIERLKGGQGEPVAWKITFTYSDQLYCIDLIGEQAVELSNNPYYKVVPLYEAQPRLAPVGFVAHRIDEIGQSFEGVIYASAILGGLVEQGTLLYTRDNSTSSTEDKS